MGAAVSGKGSHEMPMASNDSEPVHRAYVDGFWMDATPVTNAQFEKFVRATSYITIAERKPTKEEFPTAPEENLVAGGVVFAPTDHEVITLVSCWPPSGRQKFTQRVIIQAVPFATNTAPASGQSRWMIR